MSVIRIILTVLLVIDCIAVTIVVLMQEGKDNGLGAIAGSAAETYWSKNRNRSLEGKLIKATRIMVVLFFLLSIVLNLKVI